MTIVKNKYERDLILSDSIICAVLSVEADAIGVSLEEYVDRFLEAFYKAPKKFISITEKYQ